MDKLVIFNWDPRSERLVREVHADIARPGLPILVLTPTPVDTSSFSRDPLFQGVTFLTADIWNPETLVQLEVPRASMAVVLADRDAADPDGANALVVLALRQAADLAARRAEESGEGKGAAAREAQGRLHVVAETVNHRKMDLIRAAGADEVICSSDFGLGVLAQTVLTPHISGVYDQLLRFGKDTCEVYCLRVRSDADAGGEIDAAAWQHLFAGASFQQAAANLLSWQGEPGNPLLLIGARRHDSKDGKYHLYLNPVRGAGGGFDVFRTGDEPIVIAYQLPRLFLGGRGRDVSPDHARHGLAVAG